MTSSILKFLDLFRWLYERQGIDYAQLRSMVSIKLEMDNRRPSSIQSRQTEDSNAAFAWVLFVYFILSGLISLMIAFLPSLIMIYSIFHAYLMVMITMTLVSDFSSVLLDTSDNTIVLHRPISNKTFYAARTAHIFAYVGMISASLSFLPILTTFFVNGIWAGIALVITTLFTIILSVALTNGLYLLLMRFTSEERLKNLINYFQIVMVIFMTGGYQILPRLINRQVFENISFAPAWWSVFIPPLWMATVIQEVKNPTFNTISLLNFFLAFTVPLVLWKAIYQYLTPYYTKKLADLGTSSVGELKSKSSQKKSTNAVGAFLAGTSLERASFNLTSFGFARDRKLKLRVYPALGYFLVMVVVFAFRGKGDNQTWIDYLHEISSSSYYLPIIYMCIFMVMAASYEIHFTDDYKAAWVFQSAPIEKPGELLLGNIKAIIIRYFIPMYLLLSVLILSIWSWHVVPDLIAGFVNCLILMLSIGLIGDKYLPLSQPTHARTQGTSMARSIIIILFVSLLGFAHFLMKQVDYLLPMISFVNLIICWILYSRYSKLTIHDLGFI
ncbi:MAG: hypothetical protein HOP30_13080 [Cyclobacteriaceae bacterium]|nr:hypothetical protein [Cyclobacteriaceae bacterium]